METALGVWGQSGTGMGRLRGHWGLQDEAEHLWLCQGRGEPPGLPGGLGWPRRKKEDREKRLGGINPPGAPAAGSGCSFHLWLGMVCTQELGCHAGKVMVNSRMSGNIPEVVSCFVSQNLLVLADTDLKLQSLWRDFSLQRGTNFLLLKTKQPEWTTCRMFPILLRLPM